MPEEEWKEFAEPTREEEDVPTWGEDPAPEGEGGEFFSSFDPKWRQEFQGLAYLGHLEGKVEIPYHSFTLRTLTTGEKIKVVELVSHLEASIGYPRAYRAAVVAAGLMTVDGKPLLVGAKDVDAISQRYRYITDHWYDYVIETLFDKVNELEGRVLEVLKELGIYDNRREVTQVAEAEVAE